MIRILEQWIRIWIPKRVWIIAQQQSDSNPFLTYSNPNSNKGYFDGLIRITIQVIRITIQVIRIPGEKEVKLRATDSNHLYSDSNPSWRTSEEIEARIRIIYTMIRIPKSRLIKYKARRFESLSYGFKSLHKLKQKAESRTEQFESSSYWFESLLGEKFKYCKGDLNHLNNDSNHLLCRSIYCSTCSCKNLTFNSNLSHNS